MKSLNIRAIIAVIALSVFAACKGKKAEENTAETGEGTYFSIIQFTKDQLDTYWGQPFTLVKTVTLNGKTDSTYEQSLKMDWASVFKVFFESDIGKPKFLDKYKFSTFEDNATDSRIYYYEATEPELYTRSLQISTDPLNNKIKNIYIETKKNSSLTSKAQKLYYTPLKVIQIQETETGTGIKDRDLRVVYRFLY